LIGKAILALPTNFESWFYFGIAIRAGIHVEYDNRLKGEKKEGRSITALLNVFIYDKAAIPEPIILALSISAILTFTFL
jgi:hypothetical protein